MPRPSKPKEVCRMPSCRRFSSSQSNGKCGVNLTVEEFECIRLIDYIGASQAETAKGMGVARTTVTRLYDSARKKIATYLIEGNDLKIAGGSYELCIHKDCNNCPKHKIALEIMNSSNNEK